MSSDFVDGQVHAK